MHRARSLLLTKTVAALLGLLIPGGSADIHAATLESPTGNHIEYQVRGQGEPTIVFISGWAGEMADWEVQLAHFATSSRVLAMDVPGFGRSVNARDRWTMMDFGEDVAWLLEHLRIENAVLVGHSMGAGVILEAARRAPDRVAILVPVDVFHDVDQVLTDEQIRARVDGMVRFLDTVTEEDIRDLYGTNVDDAVIQRDLETYRSAPRAGWRAAGQSYFTWKNGLADTLRELATPIHCINSDRFPNRVDTARRYATDFQVTVVPGVGHAVMAEAPDAFNRALEDIVATQDAEGLRMASPESVGMSSARLARAHDLFVHAVEEERVLGYQILVARHGRVILHEAGGVADLDSGRPMTTDTLLNVGSMTKSVAAVALLTQVERGRIDLDDPVARHLPEFESGASRAITVRHLLQHTAGYTNFDPFCDGLTPRSEDQPTAPSLLVEAAEAARKEPDVAPGTSYRYNNLGYNIAGAILEKICGKTLDVVLRSEIFDPLGMERTTYDTKVTQHADVASQYWFRNGTWELLDTAHDTIPRASGGLLSNAWEFARFGQMLLDGGRLGATRLLEPETVALATSPLLEVEAAYLPVAVEAEMGLESEWYEHRDARSLGLDTHRGLGFVVAEDGAYSHAGIYGTFYLVDPARDLLIVILTQSIYGDNPGQAFIEAVQRAVVSPR